VYHILRFGPTLIMGSDQPRFPPFCRRPGLFHASFPLDPSPQLETLPHLTQLCWDIEAIARLGLVAPTHRRRDLVDDDVLVGLQLFREHVAGRQEEPGVTVTGITSHDYHLDKSVIML
jgi:hypothetical protein